MNRICVFLKKNKKKGKKVIFSLDTDEEMGMMGAGKGSSAGYFLLVAYTS